MEERDEVVVGAVVAVEPSALAGEVERIGEETDVAERVPGTVNAPYRKTFISYVSYIRESNTESINETNITGIEIDEQGVPLPRRTDRVIREYFRRGRFPTTLRPDDQHAWGLWGANMLSAREGRRISCGAVSSNAHLLEREMDIRVWDHGGLIGHIFSGGLSSDVQQSNRAEVNFKVDLVRYRKLISSVQPCQE